MMHAPGIIVALTSSDGSSSHVYGYSDLETKALVDVGQPFWIGSICKSFVGLIAIQLRDEGKLDLHKPVLEIMPDLPFQNDFGPITAHHLLTNTSGLPNGYSLFRAILLKKRSKLQRPAVALTIAIWVTTRWTC